MFGSKVDIEINSNSEYSITPVTISNNTCADEFLKIVTVVIKYSLLRENLC